MINSVILVAVIMAFSSITNAQTSPIIFGSNLLQPSPFDNWKTLKTEHFNINYQAKNLAFAQRMAVISEQVHNKLVPFMKWNPTNTQIVINDSVDSSNGAATVVNYNTIFIYMNTPIDGELMDHTGWLELLFTHEYTHILHLDQTSGIPKDIRNIFGRSISISIGIFPQLFAPNWVSEGIAIYNESKKGFGRGNNALFTSKMRQEVITGLRSFTAESYEGSYSSRWPFGQIYLYGAYFYQFVADKYGEDKVIKYITNYNRSIIPFRMDSRSQITFGVSSAQMWEQYQAYLINKFTPQIEHIKTKPTQQLTTVVDDKYINHLITTGPNNSVFYYHFNGSNKAEIRQVDAKGNQTTIKAINNVVGLNWHPKKGLLVSRETICDNTNKFVDLYQLNVKNKDSLRLTKCQRLPRAIWHSNGKDILAVQVGSGMTNLVSLSPNNKKSLYGDPTILSHLGFGEAIGDFNVNPAGTELVASVKRAKTGWNLELFDLQKNSWRNLTASPAKERAPVYTADGQGVLYVSNTKSNQQLELYRLNLQDNTFELMTNSLGYISDVSIADKQSAWVVEYTGTNQQIRFITQLTNIEQLSANKVNFAKLDTLITSEPNFNPSSIQKGNDYSAWNTLKPVGWLPIIYSLPKSTGIGISITGKDVLGFHKWAATPMYYKTSKVSTLGGSASYSYYNRFNLLVNNQLITYTETNSNNNIKISSYDEVTSAQAMLNYPINSMYWAVDISLGAAHSTRNNTRIVNNSIIKNKNNIIGGKISFNNFNYYNYSISASEGIQTSIIMESYDPIAGSDNKGSATIAELNGYIPLGGTHILKLAGLTASGGKYIQPFQLGNSSDSLSYLGNFTQLGKRNFYLRGYRNSPQLSGTQITRATIEYRFPIAVIYDGWRVFPAGLGKIHGAIFNDNGSSNINNKIYSSVGAELSAEILFGFDLIKIPITLGIAQGKDSKIGGSQLYFKLGGQF